MPSPDRDPRLALALAVVGYQWALHGDELPGEDPFAGLEQLREQAAAFPDDHRPLAEVYPHVARMAAASLRVLALLGDPDEVDGLRGFEGFSYWRESR